MLADEADLVGRRKIQAPLSLQQEPPESDRGIRSGELVLVTLRKKALATALAAVVPVVLATATSASAQQANPKPTSCAGVAFTDPAGDATTTPTTTRDNLDLRAGFLRYVTNASGENVLTANIQVTDLDKTLEAGAFSNIWEFRWTSGGTDQYVRLVLHSDGRVFFYYGTYAAGADPFKGDLDTFRGDTTGRMFLGKDGIVEIVIPVAELKLDGKRLTNPHAVSKVWYTDYLLNIYAVVADSAPDNWTGGKAFDVVPCAEEGTPARLNLKVIIGKLSARKISKRRSLSIGLLAGEKTTALQVRLKRGKKVVATGSLAAISGKGAVKLKLKGKKKSKLKAGTYTLQLTGRNATGQVASRLVQVRIRR
jgi:hypothetical protein